MAVVSFLATDIKPPKKYGRTPEANAGPDFTAASDEQQIVMHEILLYWINMPVLSGVELLGPK